MAEIVRLSAKSLFEKSVLGSKLRALGAEGFEGETQISGQHLKNAQVTPKDLERARGRDGLSIAALDGIATSSRWGGLRSVAINRGDPTAAQAAITDHLAKLTTAEARLKAMAHASKAGDMVATMPALGSLSTLLRDVAGGIEAIDTDAVRAHLSQAQVGALVDAHRTLLAAYGEAGQVIRAQVLELDTKSSLTLFAELMGHLGRLLERAPLFEELDSNKASNAGTAQSAIELWRDGETTQKLVEAMNAAHPVADADADARAHVLVPFFDRPAFKALPLEERAAWMSAFAALPPSELRAEVGVLTELMRLPEISLMSGADLRSAVDRLTSHAVEAQAKLVGDAALESASGKLQGLSSVDLARAFERLFPTPAGEVRPRGAVSIADQERFQRLTRVVSEQIAYRAPSFTYEMPRRKELDAQIQTIRDAADRVVMLKAKGEGLRKSFLPEWHAELEEIPQYPEWRKWKGELDAIDKEIEPHAKRLKEAYASSVIREETEALTELNAQRAVILRDDRFSGFEAEHIKPINDRYEERIRTHRSNFQAEIGEVDRIARGARESAQGILRSAFTAAGMSWALNNFRAAGNNAEYDQAFVPNDRKARDEAQTMVQDFEGKLRCAEQNLGIFAIDRRAARARTTSELDRDAEALKAKGATLEALARTSAEQRAVWNTLVAEASRLARV